MKLPEFNPEMHRYGKPCKKYSHQNDEGKALRWKTSGMCVACHVKWYEENKDRLNKDRREDYELDPDKFRHASTVWRTNHPEKYKEYQREYQRKWHAAHPGYRKEADQEYYHKRKAMFKQLLEDSKKEPND